MSARTHIAAVAMTLTLATFGQANAADGRFFVPPVIGAAYQDRSIATNPDEVRRQGGFETPAAVRWLPAQPATSDVPVASAQATTTLEAIDAIRMLTPEQLQRRDETRVNLENSLRVVQHRHEAALQ